MKCPVCKSRRFFVKNPEDEYDMFEFEWTPEKIVFISEPFEVSDDTRTLCSQCSWHGKVRDTDPTPS